MTSTEGNRPTGYGMMSFMQRAEALVLRSVDFSESSLILTLYTREFGKIEALAKGGRRLKGPFESALDILARIRVIFFQKKGDSLDLLTEAKLLRRFHVSSSNLAGLYGGYYVAELVHALTDTNDPAPDIFDLAVETLEQLETGNFVMRSLIRFEGRLLQSVGQQPSLRRCVECGKAVEAETNRRGRIAFGHLDGGVICSRCRADHQQVAWVTPQALRTWEQLADSSDRNEHWKHLSLERNLLGEIRGLCNHYISHLIGRKPRLHDWLKFISKNDKEETDTVKGL